LRVDIENIAESHAEHAEQENICLQSILQHYQAATISQHRHSSTDTGADSDSTGEPMALPLQAHGRYGRKRVRVHGLDHDRDDEYYYHDHHYDHDHPEEPLTPRAKRYRVFTFDLEDHGVIESDIQNYIEEDTDTESESTADEIQRQVSDQLWVDDHEVDAHTHIHMDNDGADVDESLSSIVGRSVSVTPVDSPLPSAPSTPPAPKPKRHKAFQWEFVVAKRNNHN